MKEEVEEVLRDFGAKSELLKMEGSGGKKVVKKGATAIDESWCVSCEIGFAGDGAVGLALALALARGMECANQIEVKNFSR